MERLPGETLQQYFARLKKLRGGSLLGTAGMMDQPVSPPTVEAAEITTAPLGQVVVQQQEEDNSDSAPTSKPMTPEEIIARQVERLQDKGTGYAKTAGGLMGPLGYAFGAGAEAFERQSAEFQLGKKLMGDEYRGLEDRSKAIEIGADLFSNPDKLQGMFTSGQVPGFTIDQGNELYAEPPKASTSVMGLFEPFVSGIKNILGIEKQVDLPSYDAPDLPTDVGSSNTVPVAPPPSFQVEDTSGGSLAEQLEQEVISNSWMSDASKDFI